MLHNEFHIMEPAKVVMLCTLVDVDSLPSASSLALISNNNEVLTVTDTIDVLITPKPPLTCHEILNLTILFRESNGLSGIYKVLRRIYYFYLSGVPRVGADRSAWGRFIGVHLYFIGVLL